MQEFESAPTEAERKRHREIFLAQEAERRRKNPSQEMEGVDMPQKPPLSSAQLLDNIPEVTGLGKRLGLEDIALAEMLSHLGGGGTTYDYVAAYQRYFDARINTDDACVALFYHETGEIPGPAKRWYNPISWFRKAK